MTQKRKSSKEKLSDSVTSKYFRLSSESKTDEDNERKTKNDDSKDEREEHQAEKAIVKSNPKCLDTYFFAKSCQELAKSLLGQIFVKIDNGKRLSGRIVETEAYIGGEDKASHSCGNKQTNRNKAMFMAPGTVYVYNIYGMYCCINISSKGEGAAVLIRGIQPIDGIEQLRSNRIASGKSATPSKKPLKDKDLCNGPSKLCQSFKVNKSNGDQQNLTDCDYMWLEKGDDVPNSDIVTCSRIGVNNPEFGDWSTKALRYYIVGNACVSVRDKTAEANM
ncbi:unnamed protein product [Owenia fusiformis]|uniref:DNA-3-methyladenine glycosylase n=1 Tax=Owenia fusiformis TaxID=6347 RepID=A0A8J1UA44_OWEFU|nr:unnamed protein product [Owenia fusiformis]